MFVPPHAGMGSFDFVIALLRKAITALLMTSLEKMNWLLRVTFVPASIDAASRKFSVHLRSLHRTGSDFEIPAE